MKNPLKLLKVIQPEVPEKDIPGAENLIYEAAFRSPVRLVALNW